MRPITDSMTLQEMQLAVAEKLPGLIYPWETHNGADHRTHFGWKNQPYPNRDIIHWPTEGLQVCHEAEKLINPSPVLRVMYYAWLHDLTKSLPSAHATYEQRLEALCRVWFPERFKNL